jgi:N6-L-threonylcarbamoyladenine synthase
MAILAIESSCDDTAVAIYDAKSGLLANERNQQHDLHAAYGGVVPEIASRDHLERIIPLIELAMSNANCAQADIEAIAYTKGPGLIGSLLVGASAAKTLAMAWSKPAVGVHHLEGHIMAAFLEDDKPEFPFICLLVSGGHTQLVEVAAFGEYKILGEALDDAVGEAFDKVAQLLNLDYPGGPAIEIAAKNADKNNPLQLPVPMLKKPGLDFSFSGLKTAVRQLVAQGDLNDQQFVNNVAAAFEESVAQALLLKLKRALKLTKYARIVCVGGVSANLRLRRVLADYFAEQGVGVYYPALKYCTDNAAMIAVAGQERFLRGDIDTSLAIEVRTRWPL